MRAKLQRHARSLLLVGALAGLSACAPWQQTTRTQYPVGRVTLSLPATASGTWADLGLFDTAPSFFATQATDPRASLALQTRAVGLRGADNQWWAVLLVQTNRNSQLPADTAWSAACPPQRDLQVQDEGSAVRLDCLRFKRWANNSEQWLGKNHPALSQWLVEHRAAPSQPYAHWHYRYATAGGAYVEVNALVDQRLLIPQTQSNAGFLRSDGPTQVWLQEMRTATRHSVSMLDGALVIPAFPIAPPQ